jgi:hypothetical protein
VRRDESSESGPKAEEVEKSCMLGDVASMCSRSGGEREAPSLRSAACCELRSASMFLYSFLSEPVDLVVYRSQPPVTLQSGVLKLRAVVTASKS